MTLVFDIVKNGKNIPSKRNFHFSENGGSIGRLDDNDWVLNDPNSYISGKHASIICKQGTYFIKDESTNGTYLKNPYKKLPKGHPIKINASDVFIIGDHEIQARFSNNDYTQNDIISSFEESSVSDDNIIPNDDFLFDSTSSDFTSVESQSPSDMDVIGILDTSSSEIESSFNNLVLEEQKSAATDEVDISDFMQNSSVIPEEEKISAPEEVFEEHVHIPQYTQEDMKPQQSPQRQKVTPQVSAHGLEASVAVLENKLGISIRSLEQAQRDALMAEIGDVIKTTLDSLKNSLEVKDKTKQDLRLSTAHLDVNANNPVRLGAAAAELLLEKNSGAMLGMMKVSDALKESFNELDAHTISLHRASKNIMNIAVSKFSPRNLENRFEVMGTLRGVLPRQQLLWKAYVDMFEVLNENPQEGISMIQDDFTKEYENISYSLKLQTPQGRNRI
ncbi:type VI secretion system-associated FHA domain protein TagH [Sulfurimonas sp.]